MLIISQQAFQSLSLASYAQSVVTFARASIIHYQRGARPTIIKTGRLPCRLSVASFGEPPVSRFRISIFSLGLAVTILENLVGTPGEENGSSKETPSPPTMSSVSVKSGSSSRMGQSSQNPAAPSGANHLLEKVNARTSTPDSEALASSDDEGEQRQESSQVPAQPPKPVRRSSWLNDTSSTFVRPRKGSIASGSMSPTASNPTTPSGETGGGHWGSTAPSTMGRTPGQATFWGAGIWSNERKDPPARLSEVLPSPTSTVPSGAATGSMFGPDSGLTQTSPTPRDGPNSQIPFAIPLHPTPKTYRSQSYSVGQMEPETTPTSGMSSSAVLGRARHPGLQHRPSRPSMLSEMASDGSMLGKVKEVEDDDDEESASESMQNSFQSTESKTIEMLTRENAMLRQQQQYNRIRPRASTGTSYFGNGSSYSLHESVPEESDYAIDELDELNDGGESFARRATNRRMSEYGGGSAFRSGFGADSRNKVDANLKKALWTTSGFPVADASQSRRHSFASMPTRQGSISSITDSVSTLDATTPEGQQQLHEYMSAYQDNGAFGTLPNNGKFSLLTSATNSQLI